MAADEGIAPMSESDVPQPPVVTRLPQGGLVVDVGRQPDSRIRRLKRGDGELAREIQAAVARSRESLGIADGAEIVPVVLLYRYGEPDYVVISS
jgi:hypothetical protein